MLNNAVVLQALKTSGTGRPSEAHKTTQADSDNEAPWEGVLVLFPVARLGLLHASGTVQNSNEHTQSKSNESPMTRPVPVVYLC